MCINTKFIYNPTKDFRFYDKLILETSCGDCEECRTMRHNEFYMRLKREIEFCMSNGYGIYFATLTYRNSHLPKMRVYDYDIEWKIKGDKIINCFSRDDWSRFYDAVVKPLRRRYKIGVNGSPRMRYFVACEYGDFYGRSHLHIIFAVPKICPGEEFYKIVKKAWYHGIIFPTSYEGGKVRNKFGIMKKEKPFYVEDYVRAVYYCSKYACKDTFFYKDGLVEKNLKHLRYQVRKFESLIKSKSATADDLECYSIVKKRLKRMKSQLPFHLSSHGFGLAFKDDFNGLSYNDICKKLEDGIQVLIEGSKPIRYNYPRYIIDKLISNVYILNDDGDEYDNIVDKGTDRHVRRELNDFGIYYKNYFHKKKVDDTFEEFKNLFIGCKFNKKFINKFNIDFSFFNSSFDFYGCSCYFHNVRNRVLPRYLVKFTSFNGDKQDYHYAKYSFNCNHSEFPVPSYIEKRKTFGLNSQTILKRYVEEDILFNYNNYFIAYEKMIKILMLYKRYLSVTCDNKKKKEREENSIFIHSYYND